MENSANINMLTDSINRIFCIMRSCNSSKIIIIKKGQKKKIEKSFCKKNKTMVESETKYIHVIINRYKVKRETKRTILLFQEYEAINLLKKGFSETMNKQKLLLYTTYTAYTT